MGYTPKHAKPTTVTSSAKTGYALFAFAEAAVGRHTPTAVAERGADLVPQPRPASE